ADPRAVAHGAVLLLQTAIRQYSLAGAEGGVARLDDLADGAADHRLAELDGRSVRLHVVHPAAHVGVEREPDGAYEDLAVLRRRHRRVDDLEIGWLRLAHRAALEQYAAVGHRPGLLPSRPRR